MDQGKCVSAWIIRHGRGRQERCYEDIGEDEEYDEEEAEAA